ncbi:MAG TPA: alpha/beta fold hydrolase [Kofleriaceae bacterium]|nr:alpha/beta fold hydrolase [Kofleriaceae bacterium]
MSDKNSTNVRIGKADLGRAALRSLHRVAPGAAAAVAARMFVTPVRRRAGAASSDATPFEVRVDGMRVRGWSWGAGPVVVLSHGWSGHGLQLAAMAQAIARRGHRAVVFDHPAHGRSDGRTATLPRMATALAAVAEHHGGAAAVVAHSLGAVAATIALAGGLEVERAVYLAPPARPDAWIGRFTQVMGLPGDAGVRVRAAVEARAHATVESIDPIALATGMTADLLVIHDRGDREVPVAAGEALVAAWPDARILHTDGLGHNRVLRDPSVVTTVGAFATGGSAEPVELRDPHMIDFASQVSSAL